MHSLKEIRMKIAEYLLINTYESVDSIAFHILPAPVRILDLL